MSKTNPNKFRLLRQMSGIRSQVSNNLFSFVLFGLLCCCSSSGIGDRGNLNPVSTKSALHPRILNHLFHVELNRHIEILGNVSDENLYLKRTFLDGGHRRAASMLDVWMSQAGLSTRMDHFRNVRGRYEGSMGGPALLIGSHYDTVIDGGIYDGAMGILVGVAALKAILLEAAVQKDLIHNERLLALLDEADDDFDCNNLLKDALKGSLLPKSLEVVAFSDEEGVRFQSTFLGSRGLAGFFSKGTLSNIIDAHGQTFLDILLQMNPSLTVDDILKTAVSKKEFAGYLEVHIEQGPMLEKEKQPLGVVSGIAGQSRALISILGEQGHAGTVPMKLRKDPMAGAAFLIHYLEKLCLGIADVDEMSADHKLNDSSLVCTVGSLNVWPDASNVIPGMVNFTVDVRSLSDSSRSNILNKFQDKLVEECSIRKLTCSLNVTHTANSVTMDRDLTQQLESAIQLSQEQSETCHAGSKPVVLPSGAGHDAIAMSDICPVSMMFVRCKKGVSHHPDEFVDPDDVATAAKATFHFIQSWLGSNRLG